MESTAIDGFDKLVMAAKLAGEKAYVWHLYSTYCGPYGMEDRFCVISTADNTIRFRGIEMSARSFAQWAVRLKDTRLALAAYEMSKVEGIYDQRQA